MNLSTISRWFFFYSLTLFSLTSYAWNALGHMVIADIAYQRLNTTAKEKIDYLVNQFNKEYPNMTSFVELAYWPDTLRAQKIQAFAHWHYIDNPISLDGSSVKDTIDTDNAVWALNQVETIVKNDHANPYDRARFLSFFVHIVADLHQPLHTVSLFSANHIEGDRGGNLYTIQYKGHRTNLHAVWDKGVGVFEGAHSKTHASQIAKLIMAKYPESFFGTQLNELEGSRWAEEGIQSAKKQVYTVQEEEPVTAAYEEKSQQLVEQEAALSGYRIAIMLNQLMG